MSFGLTLAFAAYDGINDKFTSTSFSSMTNRLLFIYSIFIASINIKVYFTKSNSTLFIDSDILHLYLSCLLLLSSKYCLLYLHFFHYFLCTILVTRFCFSIVLFSFRFVRLTGFLNILKFAFLVIALQPCIFLFITLFLGWFFNCFYS